MKSLSALIFLLACVGWSSADPWQNELEKAFNRDSAPCNDFYNHVCSNSSTIEKFTRYRGPYLIREAAKLLPADDDVVVKRIMEALLKFRSPQWPLCRFKNMKTQTFESAYLNGKWMGELAAYGRADPFLIRCVSKYYCVFESPATVAQNQWENVFLSEATGYAKGIFDGYFETLNITLDSDVYLAYPQSVHFNQIAQVDISDMRFEQTAHRASGLFVEKMSREDRHEAFSRGFDFQDLFPYLNILYAQTMYAHPETFHPEMIDEFELLVTKIIDEICEAIESSDWMTPKSRSRLSRQLRQRKIEIAIPKHHRDLKHLTELLEEYRTAVANVPDMDESGCEYEMITRAVTVTKNRLIHMRNEKGTIDFHGWGKNKKKYESNLFSGRNAFVQNGVAYLWPATIYPALSGNYSVGFKYGFAGTVIAHELFHHLGLEDEWKPHLTRIAETPHYSEMRECYYDYYGRITCADNGKECPDGKLKASEGYCDVEGNRVVHRVLMKALNQSRYRNRAKRDSEVDEFPLFGSKPILSRKGDRLLRDSDLLDVDVNEERKWHFYGLQLPLCLMGDPNFPDYASVHPRPPIRVHALIKQMKEFSEVFQCKEGDRNYALPDDEICDVFPLLVTTTTASTSTTRSTKTEERTEKDSSSSPPKAALYFLEKPLPAESEQLKGSGAVVVLQFTNCMLAVLVLFWL